MDGRVRRGELNRESIVDAALDLLVEDETLPTAQAIALRAGVAKRSVFHHFPDMDQLLTFAADTQAARHWGVLQPPAPGLSLAERLGTAVSQRAALFEAIGPVRRVAVRHESRSTALAARLRASRAQLRRHLHRHLDPELLTLDRPSLEGVHAIASWEGWESLRRHQGLSTVVARAAVASSIESALERASRKELR